MVRELKQRVKNGELGKILNIRLEMPQESFLRPPKSVKRSDFIPMISLDLGIHLQHLAYFLLDKEPIAVMSEYNCFSKYNVIDDINMFLKYDDGMIGSFWMSKIALGNRNGLNIKVYGEKASASWVQGDPEKLELNYNNGKKVIVDRGSDLQVTPNRLFNRMTPGHPAGFIEAFANLYNDIADCLDEFYNKTKINNRYVFGIEHAENGLKLLHKASESNIKKKWVKVI